MSFREYEVGMARFSRIMVPGEIQPDQTKAPDSIVPMVFATPDRAFAELAEHLHLKDTQKAPLPIISIQMLDPDPDEPRQLGGYRPQYRLGVISSSWAETSYKVMTRPQAWNMPFQIDLWAADRRQIDFLTASYLLKFERGMSWMNVNHRSPKDAYLKEGTEEIGVAQVAVTFQDVSDNSDLEPPPEENIEHRKTINLIVHGWLINEPVTVPVVRKVVYTHSDFDDETVVYDSETFPQANPVV